MNALIKAVILLMSLFYFLGSMGSKDESQIRIYFIASATMTVILLVAMKVL